MSVVLSYDSNERGLKGMIQKILFFIEEYHMLEYGDHVVAGVSGGADSVCLLLVLLELRKKYGLRLTAVHVEHGIRGEDSLRDAAFVQELCARHDVACVVKHCDAPTFAREHGMSLEEGARALRYDCFREVSEQLSADKIAVAHNQNDCGETLLFQLIRGSGLKGMRGIEPMRGNIIRPLLCVEREEIEAFLQERGQAFCTDATNLETEYSRNKIRHQVIPVLKEINDGAVEHLYRSTRYAAEAAELVEALAEDARSRCVEPNGVLPKERRAELNGALPKERRAEDVLLRESLLKEQPLIQKTLVLEVLCEQAGSRKDISEVHVLKVLELFEKQVGRRISLPYGLQAERTYDGVEIGAPGREEAGVAGRRESTVLEESSEANGSHCKISEELKPQISLELPAYGWHITARILEKNGEFQEIPKKRYTKWFDYDKIKGTLLLRNRCQGDYFIMDAQGRRQSLKKYLINEKIPARKREEILVLADGSHILWTIGGRISEAYKVTRDTERILEVQVNGGKMHE